MGLLCERRDRSNSNRDLEHGHAARKGELACGIALTLLAVQVRGGRIASRTCSRPINLMRWAVSYLVRRRDLG
jgi:hypothetical protein